MLKSAVPEMDNLTNHELRLAYDFARFTNRNIFLTGKAGTGKTTFLHNLKRSSPKRMIVVAPTGVAAINAGGVTIHSFFQLPFHPFIPVIYLPENSHRRKSDQDDHSGYRMSGEKSNIIRSLDLLVIDEISMVRADVLDAIDSALRRYKNRHLPFGGVQLLMIGDLQQLAPVVKEADRELLKDYYDSYFFFGSRALRHTDYITIELNHIYRQNDQQFITLLNKIRDNCMDTEAFVELNKRYIPDFDPDTGGGYITLTTHNNQARALNDSKLEKLPSPAHSFKAIIKDEFPELSYPNDNELVLKKGAQVMFVKNDLSGEKLFFNGKIGKVESFEDDSIIVKCPDDGFPITVEKAEWQNMKYTLDEDTREIGEKVIGTFTQYPLRLAWAITIHKSQGLTFDRAVIDAGAAFAHGQVYVALSRCRTLNGLVLSSRINHRSIIDNPVITGFIKESVQSRPGPAQLAASKKTYMQQLLTELFDFSGLIHRLSYCKKVINEHSGSVMGDSLKLFEKALAGAQTEIVDVSDKFQIQLKELLNNEPDPESNVPLQERIMKAAVFFSGKLDVILKEILAGDHIVETDNKAVRRSLNEAFGRAGKDCAARMECLNAVRSGFEISKYLDARAKSVVEVPAVKFHPKKYIDEKPVVADHPDLFVALKEWRNSKVKELGVAHYRILNQKTLLDLSNSLPLSEEALRKVAGMGKKKVLKYGREILELITSYCKMENIDLPEVLPDALMNSGRKGKDTKVASLELFRQGKTVSVIAAERKLSIPTIEGHLSYYASTGEIPVTEFVSQEAAGLILGILEGSGDLKMRTVREALGEKVSWGDIRFVVSHLKYLRRKQK